LIEADRHGRTVVYRLKMSVLEEALLGFAQTFGWEMTREGADPLASHAGPKRRPLKGEA
jgi:hypothetical protein